MQICRGPKCGEPEVSGAEYTRQPWHFCSCGEADEQYVDYEMGETIRPVPELLVNLLDVEFDPNYAIWVIVDGVMGLNRNGQAEEPGVCRG